MRHASVLRSERGVTLALMAVTLFLTLAMAAIAIDYGMIKTTKAEAQRAMDAAALAGASAFLINDPTINKTTVAVDRAKEFASKHSVHSVLVDTAGACGAAEVCVTVDLANEKVKADFARADIGLWFARRFGSATMGITATATAHAVESGITTCLMPVAIADKWHNTLPDATEDANANGKFDYKDANNNGQWDYNKQGNKVSEPWEQWVYNPSQGDYYYPPNSAQATGYASSDYGHQMVLMTLDPGSTSVSSNYLAWGKDGECRERFGAGRSHSESRMQRASTERSRAACRKWRQSRISARPGPTASTLLRRPTGHGTTRPILPSAGTSHVPRTGKKSAPAWSRSGCMTRGRF